MNKNKLRLLSVVTFAVIIVFAGILVEFFWLGAEYEVNFYSIDNTILKSEQVKRKHSATVPNEPIMPDGFVFESWDKNFSSVTHDLDIHPICSETKGKPNAFALSGAYGKVNDYVFIPLILSGKVCVSGFELDLTYDSNVLKLESVLEEDGGLLYNSEAPGVIKMNFVSTNNTTADVNLCKLKFKIIGNADSTQISLKIGKIYQVNNDETFIVPEYDVINSKVFVIS